MRVAVLACLLLLTYVGEGTLFQLIRIGGVSPHFMIIIIVSFALLRGSKEGALIGLAAGILYDITFGVYPLEMALPYTLIGYFCGRLNKNFYRENFVLPFVCTLLASVLSHVGTLFVFMMRANINFFFYLTKIIIPQTIYTITLSLVVYQLMYLLNERLERRERKTRNIF